MNKFFDFDNPFYKPLWLRLVIVGGCAAWALFEFVAGSPFWGVLFAAVGSLSFHGLFVTFNPRDAESKEKKDGDNG